MGPVKLVTSYALGLGMGNRIAPHNYCLLRGLLWSLPLGSLSLGGESTCSSPLSLVSLHLCKLTSSSPQKSPLISQDREGIVEGGVLGHVPLMLLL